ncbi:MAG TPA: hypothetical protein VEA80_00135 [Vitreimonas sp.]|uniref:hypothetical protein n=1 Tax=Vitreimonas sp. TaxID=3069702 RepID=UPI002D65E214|nr:hypothetical protein [Vitreimonas sp.]HYD85861.1 hypothetical protein [Vitreimonas sp.]
MRYRIEYLIETTDEYSVCQSGEIEGDLDRVELQARLNSEKMKLAHQAGGFQIRDLMDGGRIVALESFDDPLAGYWPDAHDQVIH